VKNRLIITVSDVKGTKSYNIHQIVTKLIFIITITAIIVIGGSFWFIDSLNNKMDTLKKAKEKEIAKLIKKEKILVTQNKLHSLEIQDKIKDIEALSSKLDDIEEIIGIKNQPDTPALSRATIAKMTSLERMYMLQVIPNGYPLRNKIVITDKFGYRMHPVLKKRKFHRGLDFRAKMKTPIYATADGVVRYVQTRNKGSFGRLIIISHNFGFETVYAHLRKTKVKIGDVVNKGDIIGLSGNSGRSTGPHLHYEVKYASMSLNPIYFTKWNLKNYEYIFNKARRVKWDSLLNQIKKHRKLQVQQ